RLCVRSSNDWSAIPSYPSGIFSSALLLPIDRGTFFSRIHLRRKTKAWSVASPVGRILQRRSAPACRDSLGSSLSSLHRGVPLRSYGFFLSRFSPLLSFARECTSGAALVPIALTLLHMFSREA